MNKLNYPTWLIPLDIARKLKEIGFNEPCLIENIETHSEDYSFINFEEEMCSDVNVQLEDVVFVKNQDLEDNLGIYKDLMLKTAIPTWEQALAWFRARGYKIAFKDINIGTQCAFYHLDIKEGHTFSHFAQKYEKAREVLVMKLIEVHKEFGNNIKRFD